MSHYISSVESLIDMENSNPSVRFILPSQSPVYLSAEACILFSVNSEQYRIQQGKEWFPKKPRQK